VGPQQDWTKEGTITLKTVKAKKLTYYSHTMRKDGSCVEKEIQCNEQCQVHAGEEDHAQSGWAVSRRRQDSPWKSQSEWQRTEIEKVVHGGQSSDRGRLKKRAEFSTDSGTLGHISE